MLLGSLWLMAQVKNFRPVTEAMLRNPAPGDWLNWRRTDNAWGFSPLNQINRQNVHQLQLTWSWAMDDTGAQVHDAVVDERCRFLRACVVHRPRPCELQVMDVLPVDLVQRTENPCV